MSPKVSNRRVLPCKTKRLQVEKHAGKAHSCPIERTSHNLKNTAASAFLVTLSLDQGSAIHVWVPFNIMKLLTWQNPGDGNFVFTYFTA
mmetsp:Transcript_14295/g.28505  ORF Transcript_14295/g.28505 Transcript_14295/m.28505 type:complete len:89 (-) Transcript_14295:265-531(-)